MIPAPNHLIPCSSLLRFIHSHEYTPTKGSHEYTPVNGSHEYIPTKTKIHTYMVFNKKYAYLENGKYLRCNSLLLFILTRGTFKIMGD